MSKPIQHALENLTIAEHQHYENLLIFPILSKLDAKQEYVMLAEALQQNWIEITEISESGSVPELFLRNYSERFVLILDGEELVGAKQNRVLNTTLLIPPAAKMEIPVSCTEQGRWSYGGPRRNYRPNSFNEFSLNPGERTSEEAQEEVREAQREHQFRASEHMMFARGKSGKMRNVHQSLKKGMGHRSNQSTVWADIQNVQMCMDVESETSAMADVYEGKKQHLQDYTNSFRLVAGQQGVLVAINGQLAGIEYLSRSENFSKVFTKIVESYSFDALARGSHDDHEQFSKESAEAWLKTMLKAKLESYPSRGVGLDYRLESEEVVGAGLIEKEEVINLSAFPQPANQGHDEDPNSSRIQRKRERQRRALQATEHRSNQESSLHSRSSGLDSRRHEERIVENLRRSRRTEKS